jgi:hypothetical protein
VTPLLLLIVRGKRVQSKHIFSSSYLMSCTALSCEFAAHILTGIVISDFDTF